ncbi:DedA family protein [Nakamurella leprariae]|uniref:VTT domain-containing protein n=1 Tax=Nakamurella leprariae TaxID=2803911 RepID=A0A938YKJ4_9ACTN|nr:VTT domain-containing protein [Nakamurella leprariae]MBM9469563.1 VTT domain-containing protein [Nakamurella leprariae]
MTADLALLPGWLSPETLISNLGSWAVLGILLIIFAECGILIGFFLPGDTLLFVAGLLVASGALDINLALFVGLLAVAAFVGNMVGYGIGYKVGPAVFKRSDAKFLKPEYIEKSSQFFARYGKITIVMARFVPIVRTVATVMAGASRMDVRIYTVFSAIGGIVWVGLVTVAGYFLGQIEFIRENVDAIVVLAVVVVVLASAVPAGVHWVQKRRAGRRGPGPSGPAPAPRSEPDSAPQA